MAQPLAGKAVAEAVQREIVAELEQCVARAGRPPGLAVIKVGSDPASQTYVASKNKLAARLGFHSRPVELPGNTSQAELLAAIDALNADPAIDGILLQLPLPKGFDATTVVDHISPDKDADGLHPVNQGLLALGRAVVFPCTPAGVLRIIDHYAIDPVGMDVVVVGRSILVGKPAAMMLSARHATVTLCHSQTRDLAGHVSRADLVVAAAGKPGMITADMVKPGAILIDVGINHVQSEADFLRYCDPRGLESFRQKGYAITGDIHPAACEKASAFTPVPGGVGLMTVTMLMVNTLRLYRKRLGL